MPPTGDITKATWQPGQHGRHCDLRISVRPDGDYSLRDLSGGMEQSFDNEPELVKAFQKLIGQGSHRTS